MTSNASLTCRTVPCRSTIITPSTSDSMTVDCQRSTSPVGAGRSAAGGRRSTAGGGALRASGRRSTGGAGRSVDRGSALDGRGWALGDRGCIAPGGHRRSRPVPAVGADGGHVADAEHDPAPRLEATGRHHLEVDRGAVRPLGPHVEEHRQPPPHHQVGEERMRQPRALVVEQPDGVGADRLGGVDAEDALGRRAHEGEAAALVEHSQDVEGMLGPGVEPRSAALRSPLAERSGTGREGVMVLRLGTTMAAPKVVEAGVACGRAVLELGHARGPVPVGGPEGLEDVPLLGCAPDQSLEAVGDLLGDAADVGPQRALPGEVDGRLDDGAVVAPRTAVDGPGHEPGTRAQGEGGGTGRHGRLLTEELDVHTGSLDVPVAQQPDEAAPSEFGQDGLPRVRRPAGSR